MLPVSNNVKTLKQHKNCPSSIVSLYFCPCKNNQAVKKGCGLMQKNHGGKNCEIQVTAKK